MRTLAWLAVFAAGFGLMIFSYWNYQRVVAPTPWTTAFLYVGEGEAGPEAADFGPLKARLRFLPMSATASLFAKGLGKAHPTVTRNLENALREKVVRLADFAEEVTPDMLSRGRLPLPGTGEALAGAQAAHQDRLVVAGRTFEIVGVLKRTVTLFADAYLVPPGSAHEDLFDPSDDEVLDAYVLRMPRKRAVEAETRKRLAQAFPKDAFTPMVGQLRVEAGPFYLYMAGMGLMLLGGSAVLIRLYVYLAGAVRWSVVRAPLETIRQRRRLFAAIHVVVFGSLVLLSVAAYHLPAIQTVLLASTGQALAAESGPLAMAGKAYMSGSIPHAAVVTIGVNFLLGSLLMITLPSVVLGAGSLMAWFRAGLIGLILAPSIVRLSGVMVPHSLTILVEMEAYIVAAFFGLMIPIHAFRRAPGTSWLGRYGRALLLNLKAQVLVLALLVVAGVYEAIEVILQSR